MDNNLIERVEENEHKIALLFKKFDDLNDKTKEALTLAQYANKGYIELAVEMRTVKERISDFRNDLVPMKDAINAMNKQMMKNLMWTVGINFTLLSIFFVLIKLT